MYVTQTMQDDKIGEVKNKTKEDENQTKEDENQTKKTKIRPLLFSGGRSEGESRLLAPVLFCTPANLMPKNITNLIML